MMEMGIVIRSIIKKSVILININQFDNGNFKKNNLFGMGES